MIITIKVKPNSRIDTIEKMKDGNYRVKIKAPPIDGKANDYLIAYLSSFFEVAKKDVKTLTGHTASIKRIEVSITEEHWEEKFQKYI